MSVKKVILSLAVAVGLAGCGETTTIHVPAGLSASQAVDSIVFPRAIATVVSENCTSKGVTLREWSWKAGVRRDLQGLIDNGYSLQELSSYSSKINKEAMTKKAIRYLEQRGVKQGKVSTLCKFGRDEISKKSTIGQLLKQI